MRKPALRALSVAVGALILVVAACQDASVEQRRSGGDATDASSDHATIALPNGDELALADVTFDPSNGQTLGLGVAGESDDDLEVYEAEFDDDDAADFDALDAGLTLAAAEPLRLSGAGAETPLALGLAATKAKAKPKAHIAQPAKKAAATTGATGVARAKSGTTYKVALAKAQPKQKRKVVVTKKKKKVPAKPAPIAAQPTTAPTTAPQPAPGPLPTAAPGPKAVVTLCAGIGAESTCQNWSGAYFQQCLDNLPAGGVLSVPPGCYLLESSLTLRDQKKIDGHGQVTFRFLNNDSGLEMSQTPNKSRADGVTLTYASGAFDVFPFAIVAVQPGNAIGLQTPSGNRSANYRVQLNGKDYDLFLKDPGHTLARAFTSWFVDGSGLFLQQEINAPNAPGEMSVDTSPMQFAKRYTYVGDYVWSANFEYATANTDDNPCRQVSPATGSSQDYKDQWTTVTEMGLKDLGGDLGQQQTLVLHQYYTGKPFLPGEYHYFARGFGDVAWVNKDANGQIAWGNADGQCPDKDHCANGWSQEIIWNTIAPPQAADMRYKCW